VRLFACVVVLMNYISSGYASTPANIPDVATLDLASLLPRTHGNLEWTTVAFVSETSIAVGLCAEGKPDKCSLSLVRWEGGVLRPFAQTSVFSVGCSIHPASEGRIFTTRIRSPEVLYSPDLSASLRLPPLYLSSRSGSTVATITKGHWRIYHLGTGPELIREGSGSLRSISDAVVVFQAGTVMRTETLEGKVLGSFSVAPEEKCYNGAEPLSNNRLYLNDCKSERIVDFNGCEQLKLRPPKGCCDYDVQWSADGKRLLFDYTSRKVTVFRSVGEIALALGTLGAGAGDQFDNRQEVRVVDAVTGGFCFDWRRSFLMGAELHFANVASISPSGEFVAIAAEKTLSIYHLPAVCETQK
jgi:hypothetical protein